jgi:Type IV secretion system pilin
MKKTSLFIVTFVSGVFLIFAQSSALEQACESKGGIYNSSTGSCPVTESSCDGVGGGYDMISGICYTTPEDKCDNISKGTYDAMTGRCLSRLDICSRNGGVLNSATGECAPGVTSGVGSVFTPGGTVGGSSSTSNGLLQLLALLKTVVNQAIPILVGFAVLAFFWFLVLFIWRGSDNSTERDKMKSGMMWSIVALFVMVSVWGIIALIGSILGVQPGGTMHGFKLPGQS